MFGPICAPWPNRLSNRPPLVQQLPWSDRPPFEVVLSPWPAVQLAKEDGRAERLSAGGQRPASSSVVSLVSLASQEPAVAACVLIYTAYVFEHTYIYIYILQRYIDRMTLWLLHCK